MLIFFWSGESDGAGLAPFHRPSFHGIRALTPAMLRRMERRAARRALEVRLREDEEEAVILLAD